MILMPIQYKTTITETNTVFKKAASGKNMMQIQRFVKFEWAEWLTVASVLSDILITFVSDLAEYMKDDFLPTIGKLHTLNLDFNTVSHFWSNSNIKD